ncbi:APC family permease [Kitasatospora sp. NPDC048540]|uniref:APC family permease n=1 Tax=unclassified Kitasatospora TaxID=2633591 RepID=UPI00068D4F84|nr:APC family permease [Kitasatospora sp. MBT63]
MSSPETSTTVTKPPLEHLRADAVALVGVIFMALATAAPITAMTGNLPVIIGSGNGVHAPVGFIFVTLVLTVFTVGYVAMARHITTAGAFYSYISHGLGRIIGMASGLLAVLAYVVFEASIAGIFAYFAETAIDSQFGVNVPWQWLAVFMLLVTSVLTHYDIKVAAKILGVFLVGEVVMLTLLAGSVLAHGGGPHGFHFSVLNPTGAFAGVNAGVGLFFCFWSWIGFESTAMYGEESRNPKRIIPLATLFAVVGLGVLYTFVSWMVLSSNGPQDAVEIASGITPLDLFLDPAQQYLGHWAVTALLWLMVTSSFACAMAFHQCASRYLYAIGRERFLPPALGHVHPRYRSPSVASLTQTGIALAIVLIFWGTGQDPYVGLYTLTAILGTLSLLVVQTLCSFSVIAYFRRNHPESRHWFRTFTAPLLGGLGMLAAIGLLLANLHKAAGPAADLLFFRFIPWIVAAVFLSGIALALYMRSKYPEKYKVMGRIVLESTTASDTRKPLSTRT